MRVQNYKLYSRTRNIQHFFYFDFTSPKFGSLRKTPQSEKSVGSMRIVSENLVDGSTDHLIVDTKTKCRRLNRLLNSCGIYEKRYKENGEKSWKFQINIVYLRRN